MRSLLLALLLGACTAVPPADRPDDFAVRYDWNTGSLPPPYHYRHVIEVGPDGAGTATVTLSYGEGPSRAVPFQLDAAALDALYADLHAEGLFSTTWREESDPPVGGSFGRVTATADGRTVEVPPFVVRGQRAAADRIAERIRAVVPASVQSDLDAWREEAQREG
ncbi:MAG TPA: hypothetical protein VK002_03645 [Rubricoccaceae bacterium]|nr:hypothetical protein [Rubricoccaceae bacterium]